MRVRKLIGLLAMLAFVFYALYHDAGGGRMGAGKRFAELSFIWSPALAGRHRRRLSSGGCSDPTTHHPRPPDLLYSPLPQSPSGGIEAG